MVTLRACRMPNATASTVADCHDPIGLGPSCNLISALSLMAGRLTNDFGSGGGPLALAMSNEWGAYPCMSPAANFPHAERFPRGLEIKDWLSPGTRSKVTQSPSGPWQSSVR